MGSLEAFPGVQVDKTFSGATSDLARKEKKESKELSGRRKEVVEEGTTKYNG